MFELNLDISHFLDTYWQKKPTVIKKGFIDFDDPIMPDEIAGLSMEEEIESRLVYKVDDQWHAESGPFTDFEKLENEGVSLLVQAVDHWHVESQELVRPFRFLPNWRIDDLMISYSTSKGGVGPHIDNYDVFIIQGLGKRHWRVGKKNTQQPISGHGVLRHCEPFDAIINVNLEPGDILYIPSGCPHEGYAIEPSINYSVGFRAPDQNDLLSSFTDYNIDNNEPSERYIDNVMQVREKPGQIETQELEELHRVMLAKCQTPDALIPWFGKMVSEAKHELDIAEIEQPHTSQEILNLFEEGAQFTRLGGLRAIYFEQAAYYLFINGDQFDCEGFTELGHHLCDQDEVGSEVVELLQDDTGALNLFTKLVNLGYWYAI
ncbi:cupin domain-containing protein [Psychromonas antarctica]|uniref:ribosomal protein uL16 3-hydroxylase n=1 Tax=Psychromonas antarctica TaxID=67573 RepID=UPI001EE8BEAA|nr:cupin domain-containing protein [Psychromonas antarctica]MCG6202360.1 cupin domain-containing protein [Psychromonas antarctica]